MPSAHRRHFGSARKLPSGRYQARYKHAGEAHIAPDTFTTKSDALASLRRGPPRVERHPQRGRHSAAVMTRTHSSAALAHAQPPLYPSLIDHA